MSISDDTTTVHGAVTIGEQATLEGTLNVLDAVAERDWQVGSTLARVAARHLRESQSMLTAAEQGIAVAQTAANIADSVRLAAETERDALRSDLTQLRMQLTNAIDEGQRFANRVRAAAIDVQSGHSGHISMYALNEWLDELGLAKVETDWECSGSYKGIDLPGATVKAEDEESARDKYTEALSGGDWSVVRRFTGSVRDGDGIVFDFNEVDESLEDDDDFSWDDVEITVSEA